jgi:hypothetical protein
MISSAASVLLPSERAATIIGGRIPFAVSRAATSEAGKLGSSVSRSAKRLVPEPYPSGRETIVSVSVIPEP